MDKKKIISYIQKHHMIQPGDSVIAAVSGGADSVALLFVLRELSKEMGFALFAVHVEHGIRGEESLKDMRFTEELCEKLEVPLRIFHVDAPSFAKENGLGLEEAARRLRYERLEAAARELQQEMADTAAQTLQYPVSDTAAGKLWQEMPETAATLLWKSTAKTGTVKIALAHHMQDQAETVLFRLARGSGLNGLAGMQPVRQGIISETEGVCRNGASEKLAAHQDGSDCTYIRPLLATSRGEIEEYLAECGQTYCVDSTNLDESYARNRIRSRVLPELTGINAQAAAHIAQAAEQAAEISDYIAGEAAREFERIATLENGKREVDSISPMTQGIGNSSCPGECPVKISIEIPKLLCLHPALQKELLRQSLIRIAGHEKDLTAGHVARIMELAERTSGKEISLPYDVIVTREFDRLVFRKRTLDTRSDRLKKNDEKQQKREKHTPQEQLETGESTGQQDRQKWKEQRVQGQQETRKFVYLTAGKNELPMEFIEISAEQLEEIKKTGEALRVALSASEEMVFRISGAQVLDGNVLPDTNDTAGQTASGYVNEVSGQKTSEYANETTSQEISECANEKTGKKASGYTNEESVRTASGYVSEESVLMTSEHANERSCRKVFDYDKLKDGFAIRHRCPGDYFRMKDGHRKKLKQYLIEEKIPVSERPKLWLLAHGSQILWLPGGREDPALRPCGSTEFVISVEYGAL